MSRHATCQTIDESATDADMARSAKMAQTPASVMFDLRLIGGTASHFTDLQAEVLEMAANNAILLKHRIANSLKHTPPLG